MIYSVKSIIFESFVFPCVFHRVASKNYEELTDVSMKLSMEAKTVVSQIEVTLL